MVIAQTVLITPIIAALSRQVIEDLWTEYCDELTAMEVGPLARVKTLLWDARFSLVTILLAGFGRAAAEVGAVMIVGGNIEGFTRVMTTDHRAGDLQGQPAARDQSRRHPDHADHGRQRACVGRSSLV